MAKGLKSLLVATPLRRMAGVKLGAGRTRSIHNLFLIRVSKSHSWFPFPHFHNRLLGQVTYEKSWVIVQLLTDGDLSIGQHHEVRSVGGALGPTIVSPLPFLVVPGDLIGSATEVYLHSR